MGDRSRGATSEADDDDRVTWSGYGVRGAYGRAMASRLRSTDEDTRTAIRIALSGVARGVDLGDIAARLAPLHPRNDTFPGVVLLNVAADVIELSGASRADPIEVEGIRERFLPEAAAHTKAQHHKSMFALRAAAMLAVVSIRGFSTRSAGGGQTICGTGRSKRSSPICERERTGPASQLKCSVGESLSASMSRSRIDSVG